MRVELTNEQAVQLVKDQGYIVTSPPVVSRTNRCISVAVVLPNQLRIPTAPRWSTWARTGSRSSAVVRCADRGLCRYGADRIGPCITFFPSNSPDSTYPRYFW